MKNVFLLTTFLFSVVFTFAQNTELWGAFYRGGEDYNGRLIAINNDGSTATEIHRFPDDIPGALPDRTRMISFNNHLYGFLKLGGKYNNGIIFKYNPVTNIVTKLFDFNDSIGVNPSKGLTLLNNKMYGICASGGANGSGTIFEFDPLTKIFTKKFDLNNTTGGGSSSALTAFDGKLYGVTNFGAANSFGAIIKYDLVAGTCVAVKNLANDAATGRDCFSGLTVLNDKLYGSLRFAGASNVGNIFELDPSTDIFTVKYSLKNSTPSDFIGSFTAAGNVLYASPHKSASTQQYGSIVEYNPTLNTLVTKINFNPTSLGAGSYSDLTFYNGKYYGSNVSGGSSSYGGFFEWDPTSNTLTQRISTTPAIGQEPSGTFVELNGNLYSTTRYTNNSYGGGNMIKWDLSNNSITKLFEFGINKGRRPDKRLVQFNGKVYGTTAMGGVNGNGVIFSKDLTTGAYNILYNFLNPSRGSSTHSQLSINNGKIYGLTDASSNSYGAIFEFDIASSTYTEKYKLTFAGGYEVAGTLILINGSYYGISRSGGSLGNGTIFSWNPLTNIFTNNINLNEKYNVSGGFTNFNELLYVPTSTSGPSGSSAGKVIKFNPVSKAFASIAAFSSSIGNGSIGEFTEFNGKLFTTTYYGGSYGGGCIIAFDPDTETFTKMFEFSGSTPLGISNTGSNCNGLFTLHNNELYGLTASGGLTGSGGSFKYNPVTNVFSKIVDISGVGSEVGPGNGFIVVQSNIVLPVKLNYFSVVKQTEKSVLISWETNLEHNNTGFNIQRSADGTNFINIGWRSGTNNNVRTAYNFTDENTLNGNNYYRFEQVDYDGKKWHSTIKKITFANRESVINVYPNPVLNDLIIEAVTTSGTLKIMDNKGALIKLLLINKGRNYINLSSLSRGQYFYSIILSEGGFHSGSFNKQ